MALPSFVYIFLGPDEFRAECLQAMDDLTFNYIIKLYGATIALEYVPAKWREVTEIYLFRNRENQITLTKGHSAPYH
jgi:hypothetical protein